MQITGLMIHEAFMAVDEHARPWDMLTEESQTRYQQVADKLNEAVGQGQPAPVLMLDPIIHTDVNTTCSDPTCPCQAS